MATNISDKLVIGISSRTLFDLRESNEMFEKHGVDAYADYQIKKENEVLLKGVAFGLVQKLLGLNQPDRKLVEVILTAYNKWNLIVSASCFSLSNLDVAFSYIDEVEITNAGMIKIFFLDDFNNLYKDSYDHPNQNHFFRTFEIKMKEYISKVLKTEPVSGFEFYIEYDDDNGYNPFFYIEIYNDNDSGLLARVATILKTSWDDPGLREVYHFNDNQRTRFMVNFFKQIKREEKISEGMPNDISKTASTYLKP